MHIQENALPVSLWMGISVWNVIGHVVPAQRLVPVLRVVIRYLEIMQGGRCTCMKGLAMISVLRARCRSGFCVKSVKMGVKRVLGILKHA